MDPSVPSALCLIEINKKLFITKIVNEMLDWRNFGVLFLLILVFLSRNNWGGGVTSVECGKTKISYRTFWQGAVLAMAIASLHNKSIALSFGEDKIFSHPPNLPVARSRVKVTGTDFTSSPSPFPSPSRSHLSPLTISFHPSDEKTSYYLPFSEWSRIGRGHQNWYSV